MSNVSGPFALLGISSDDLRCLTDEEVKKLIIKKAKRASSQYEKGTQEWKKIVSCAKKLLRDESLRRVYTKVALKRVIDISKSCLLNGAGLTSVAINIVDTYEHRYPIMVMEPKENCKKVSYFFDDLGNLVLAKDNRYVDVKDRKVIGCILFGTRPYDVFDSFVIKRATCIKKSYFFDHFGHEHQEVTKWWVPEVAKRIPQSLVPFGIEHYIFPDINCSAKHMKRQI